MAFSDWLIANGFDPETISEQQRLALQAGWRAEQAGDRPAVNPEAAANAGRETADAGAARDEASSSMNAHLTKVKANNSRVRRIGELVAEAVDAQPHRVDEFEELGRKAIAGGWDATATEVAILRTQRPLPAGVGSPERARVPGPKVLEAAVAQAAGLPNLEANYDERTLEAAHKQYRGGLGIQQLIGLAAQANGLRSSAPVKNNLRESLEYAFRPRADGGISNVSLSGVLSNVANKFSRESFLSVDQSWKQVAATRSVNDFKTITSYSLSGDLEYKEIAPGGEIKHGNLGETSYTNQAKSYGRMLGLDRRDIVNDNIGALSQASRRLGRGGITKLNKVFWAEYLDNSSFFSSGNANVSTGAGSALSLAGLEAANAKFLAQTDPDGNLTAYMPKILLVPPALWATAMTLMGATGVNATTTANTPLPNANPWAGMFTVVMSPYLQDSTLTGYSAAAWYLLADPNDVPVIEVAFLNGQQVPTVESADLDFDMLGIQLRGYFDFGANLQEYRGGVRSAGS